MSSTTLSPSQQPATATYPYPHTVNIANFISVKLIGHNNYHIWKTQFLCLIQGHDMFGFIDNTFPPPLQQQQPENMPSWKRSDSLLRGWILSSLTEGILTKTLTLNTAKDVWNFLEDSYSTLTLESAHARSVSLSESEGVSVMHEDDDHWKFDSGNMMMKRFSTPHSRSLPVPLRGVSQQIDLKGDSVTSGVDGRMNGRSMKTLRGLEESYSLELDEISDFLHGILRNFCFSSYGNLDGLCIVLN
ncbi:ankyrin repeat-containing domain-containing LTR copia-type protein [Tanacetum coccineum]